MKMKTTATRAPMILVLAATSRCQRRIMWSSVAPMMALKKLMDRVRRQLEKQLRTKRGQKWCTGWEGRISVIRRHDGLARSRHCAVRACGAGGDSASSPTISQQGTLASPAARISPTHSSRESENKAEPTDIPWARINCRESSFLHREVTRVKTRPNNLGARFSGRPSFVSSTSAPGGIPLHCL